MNGDMPHKILHSAASLQYNLYVSIFFHCWWQPNSFKTFM